MLQYLKYLEHLLPGGRDQPVLVVAVCPRPHDGGWAPWGSRGLVCLAATHRPEPPRPPVDEQSSDRAVMLLVPLNLEMLL